MSADILREAAAPMRERAEAVPPSPWSTYETFTHRCIKTAMRYGWRERQVGYATEAFPQFADHAASWHPAVAFAVADWLDEMAAEWNPDFPQDSAVIAESALAVARAYLGSDS